MLLNFLTVLEKTLKSPLDFKQIQPVHPKGIFIGIFSPEYSLEGLMLKLKLQYFRHLMERTDSLEKTLKLGEVEDKRRRGKQRMRWLDNSMDSRNMTLRDGEGLGSLACCSPWGCKESDTTQQLNSNNHQDMQQCYPLSRKTHTNKLVSVHLKS